WCDLSDVTRPRTLEGLLRYLCIFSAATAAARAENDAKSLSQATADLFAAFFAPDRGLCERRTASVLAVTTSEQTLVQRQIQGTAPPGKVLLWVLRLFVGLEPSLTCSRASAVAGWVRSEVRSSRVARRKRR